MPRPRTARRFDPRPGVSQAMVDVEAQRVAQEANDCRICATTDIRQRLADRVKLSTNAELELRDLVSRLPEQEQLVVRCLLTRDAYHLLATYVSYVRSLAVDAAAPPTPAPAPPPEPVTPFSKWLFGGP